MGRLHFSSQHESIWRGSSRESIESGLCQNLEVIRTQTSVPISLSAIPAGSYRISLSVILMSYGYGKIVSSVSLGHVATDTKDGRPVIVITS